MDGEALRGSAEGELHRGGEVATFSATFEVTVTEYRYPPELACNFPGG